MNLYFYPIKDQFNISKNFFAGKAKVVFIKCLFQGNECTLVLHHGRDVKWWYNPKTVSLLEKMVSKGEVLYLASCYAGLCQNPPKGVKQVYRNHLSTLSYYYDEDVQVITISPD